MATKPATTTAQQGTVRTSISQVASRQSMLPLPQNQQFKYWVAHERVAFRDGVCRFNPIAVAIVPGIQNVPESGDPTTIDGLQSNRLGRVEVPLDFEVIAWGEKVRGYLCELELGHDRNGKRLVHFHDVWTRYQKLGATMVQSFDHDGWADFCVRVEKLMGGPPHQQIAEAERSRQVTLADKHRRVSHVSVGSDAVAARILANLSPAKPEKAATK